MFISGFELSSRLVPLIKIANKSDCLKHQDHKPQMAVTFWGKNVMQYSRITYIKKLTCTNLWNYISASGNHLCFVGDNSLFRDLIDDINFAILPVKKKCLRDTFSCDLDVTKAVRLRIVKKKQGGVISYPDFSLSHARTGTNQLHPTVNMLERCNKKIT